MKKTVVALLAGLLLYGGSALAETTLVITETLEPGQVGVDVSYTFQHQERKIGEGGRQWSNTSASDFGLGIGLIPNLEIDFSVPYIYSDRTKSEFPSDFVPPLQYSTIDGVGDLTVGARYAIIAPKGDGFRLAAGLDVKFDTAGERNAGSGTTDFSPIVAASYQMGNLKPYFAYQPTFRNNGAPDTHDLSIGSHIRLGESVILNPKLNVGITDSSAVTTSFEDYSFRLSGYFKLMKGLYLTTSAKVNIESPFEAVVPASPTTFDEIRFSQASSISGTVGLYFEY
jgi:hypothetical protein